MPFTVLVEKKYCSLMLKKKALSIVGLLTYIASCIQIEINVSNVNFKIRNMLKWDKILPKLTVYT